MDRLVPPQVVVVLELLVADGTDMGHTGRARHGLNRQGLLIERSSVHRGGRLGHVFRGWSLGRARMHGHEL